MGFNLALPPLYLIPLLSPCVRFYKMASHGVLICGILIQLSIVRPTGRCYSLERRTVAFGPSVGADAVRFQCVFPCRPIHTELCKIHNYESPRRYRSRCRCRQKLMYPGQWKQIPTSLKNTRQRNLDILRPPSPRTLLTRRGFIIFRISIQKQTWN